MQFLFGITVVFDLPFYGPNPSRPLGFITLDAQIQEGGFDCLIQSKIALTTRLVPGPPLANTITLRYVSLVLERFLEMDPLFGSSRPGSRSGTCQAPLLSGDILWFWCLWVHDFFQIR